MTASRRLLQNTIFGAILAATPVIAGHMTAGPGTLLGWATANAAAGDNNAGGNGGGNAGGNGGGNSGGNGGANGGSNAGGNGGGNSGGNGAANANGLDRSGNANASAGGNRGNSNSAATASLGAGNGNQGRGVASNGQLSSALGALNAAHASPTALANAAPGSAVGRLATYDKVMLSALAMPAITSTQITARNAAITSARVQLASTTNKTVTPTVITKVDLTLGLPASDPTLGTTP